MAGGTIINLWFQLPNEGVTCFHVSKRSVTLQAVGLRKRQNMICKISHSKAIAFVLKHVCISQFHFFDVEICGNRSEIGFIRYHQVLKFVLETLVKSGDFTDLSMYFTKFSVWLSCFLVMLSREVRQCTIFSEAPTCWSTYHYTMTSTSRRIRKCDDHNLKHVLVNYSKKYWKA